MNIKDIERYVKENDITFDFDNSNIIDYIPTLTHKKPMSKEDMEKWSAQIREAAINCDCRLLVVDSINGGLKEV